MIDMLALNDLVLLHRFDSILSVRVRSEPADLDQTKGTLTKVLAKDDVAWIDSVKDALSRSCFYHLYYLILNKI